MRQALTLFTCAVLMLAFSLRGFAQERYLDAVFSDVMKTDTLVYGTNVSIAPIILEGAMAPQPVNLYMDLYEPMGDTVSERPLIVFAITGTFFPAYVNGGFTGERSDIAVVDFAERMAKKGYVVAVVQYRRGWNAVGSATVQQKTILEAAYRGIQDVRNAVRFFRASYEGMADIDRDGMPDGEANPFNIDPTRIAVGGTGTGGYMAYGATYLKRYEQTLKTKFIDFDQNPPEPFLDTTLLADPYGITQAALNIPNYPTYSSDFNIGFAFGGALGDISWVEAGDAPFVSLHCERDPGAPYEIGDVIAIDGTTNPASPFAVIPGGAGGLAVLRKADSLGNQDVFRNQVMSDDTLLTIGSTKSGGIAGLYPFDTPYEPGDAMCQGTGVPGDTIQEWGGPWNLFNETVGAATWNAVFADQIATDDQVTGEVAVCLNKRGNPNDPAIGAAYMDTLEGFLTPHLVAGLNITTSVTGINDFVEDENVEVFPNPANNILNIEYRDGIKMLEGVRLMDLNGRTVRNYENLQTISFELQRENLTPGLYILQVSLPDGVVNKKILFE
ncbi:MAG: T9SS type A sorting domain-containing protein [Bacteroidota bacterium]